jgi:serine/threonine protein kinase/tetratricopeptide (TPR) repeat protein
VNCPSEEDLAVLLEGDISTDERNTLNLHIGRCGDCQLVWRRLVDSSAISDTDGLKTSRPEASAGLADSPDSIAAAVDRALLQTHAYESHDASVEQRVGRYQLRGLIGSGGMGRVYAARDPELDRDIAVKLLRADVDTQNAELRARLLREAQAMARLSHPNVISVHDVGLHGDQVFIAMELIDGRTLRQWLDDQPRSWREAVRVLLLAGRGLAAAHEVGIVHRDFKPDNVMVGRNGSVRVLDFGLARSVLSVPLALAGSSPSALATSLSGSGGLLGTPAYMAPEQLACESTDARTDQFSFCVVLYQSLTGVRPFPGTTPQALLTSIREGNRDTSRDSRLPSWLRPILNRGLDANPDRRFASMSDLLAALQHDPAVTRRQWLARATIVVVCAAIGATAYGLARRHASSLCRGGEARILDVWNAPRKERIRATFLATGLPYASETFIAAARRLDQHVKDWLAMHTETCEATRVRGEQSEEVMQLRMECLDRRREEVRALADVLGQADGKVVRRALELAENLSGLDECRNTEALRSVMRPPTAVAQAQVTALRARLADVRVRGNAGRYREALTLAQAAVDDAAKLAYQPLLAEALTSRGVSEIFDGKAEAALDTLSAAAVAAESGRYDHQLAWAFAELDYVLSGWLRRFAEANRYGQLARAVLMRAGGDPRLEAQLDASQISILEGQGRWDEAVATAKRVLARRMEILGPGVEVGISLDLLGEAYREKGDFALAVDSFRQETLALQHSFGTQHPRTAQAWNNLGLALTDQENWSAAMNAYEKALAIYEATLDPGNSEIAATLGNMASVRGHQGRFAEALALLKRAQAIERITVGTESPQFAISEINTAGALKDLGRPDEALEHARHGLAIEERYYDPQHPAVAVARLNVAEVLMAQHKEKEAVPLLEQTIVAFEHHQEQPSWLSEARFGLAQALWTVGRDHARAHALALAARQYSGAERAKIDAWLAKHR